MEQAVNSFVILDTIVSLKGSQFCASIKYSAETADEEKESASAKVLMLFKIKSKVLLQPIRTGQSGNILEEKKRKFSQLQSENIT